MFNLENLANSKYSENTYEVEIEHPTLGKTPLIIEVIGLHSDKVRGLKQRMADRALKEQFEAQRKNRAKAPTVKDGMKYSAQLLAAATVNWFTREGGDKPGEKPTIEKGMPWGDGRIQFSEEEAEKLYSNDDYDWLTKQVDDAVGDLENFIKA